MHRFFVLPEDIHDKSVTITGPEAHHLKNVLRLSAGDKIILFDGTGTSYISVITAIKKERVTADIHSFEKEISTYPLIILNQPLLPGKKLDFIIQKATELGVHSINLFHARYCKPEKNMSHKLGRWQRIALEACKQCRRNYPPGIHPPVPFTDIVEKTGDCTAKLLFWEKESGQNLEQALPKAGMLKTDGTISIIIGPEGGFAEQEISLARKAGFLTVTLGRRILRAETASITTVAIIQYLTGNLNA